MSWTTVPITQNGNTSVPYLIGPSPQLQAFDLVVLGHDSGTSSVAVTSYLVRRGIGSPASLLYEVTVRSFGSTAVTFRIRGNPVA
jgi:hypothetical protein